MPVESERAQAPRPATARPLEPLEPQAPAGRSVDGGRPAVGAPRAPHDEHELPDGRHLIAYRSAPNA